MIRKNILATICILLIALSACEAPKEDTPIAERPQVEAPKLTLTEANRLASLPYHCMQTEYPNKLNQTLEDASMLKGPKELHPAFYGCYDWHSSVHGHWSLVYLLKRFSDIDHRDDIMKKLAENMSADNIKQEVDYFTWKGNSSFERTYGWAWLLKLAEELHTWDTDYARELSANLEPLTQHIVQAYLDFLPKLNYPIRVGEHTNTAFGMSFAYDYAQTVDNLALKNVIEETVKRFYLTDAGCPITWEPSGFDFLSPCLQEADIVRKVLPKAEYKQWLTQFLPQLSSADFTMETGKVSDRADAKLVHLDGVNFSRAWCLYGIAQTLPEYEHLHSLAAEHIQHSLPSIVDDNYSGTHWLGSFALYAMKSGKE